MRKRLESFDKIQEPVHEKLSHAINYVKFSGT